MGRNNWELYFDALKKQDWEAAKDILKKISATEKNNPQVYLKMGDVYQRSGDNANAISSYHLSARILRYKGFNQKALALYKIILRLDPKNSEAINKAQELMSEMESAKGPALAFPIPSVSSEEPPAELPAAPAALPDEVPAEAMEGLEARTTLPPEEPEAEIQWSSIFTPASQRGTEEGLEDLVVPLSERGGISRVPELFSTMSEEEFNKILNEFEIRTFPDKGKAVEEGDSGDSMYIIRSGRARVIAHLLGRELELARLQEGDVFGEVAFLTGRPRTAAVIAEGTLEVYEIGRMELERLIEKNPEILSKLEDFYETRVKDTIRKVKPS